MLHRQYLLAHNSDLLTSGRSDRNLDNHPHKVEVYQHTMCTLKYFKVDTSYNLEDIQHKIYFRNLLHSLQGKYYSSCHQQGIISLLSRHTNRRTRHYRCKFYMEISTTSTHLQHLQYQLDILRCIYYCRVWEECYSYHN